MPMVSIGSKVIVQGLNPQIPTVCIRLHFTGKVAIINYLLNCILDLKKRYAWDRSLTDQRHVNGASSDNMMVFEEEFDEIIRGSAEREVILKRHIFED